VEGQLGKSSDHLQCAVSGVTKYLCICSKWQITIPPNPLVVWMEQWLKRSVRLIWTYDVKWEVSLCADCTCGRSRPWCGRRAGISTSNGLTLRSTGFLSLTPLLLCCCYRVLLVLALWTKGMVCNDHDAHPSSRCQTLQRDSVIGEEHRKKLDGNLFMGRSLDNLICSEVFRPPAHAGTFSVLVGTGAQIFAMTLLTLVFAVSVPVSR